MEARQEAERALSEAATEKDYGGVETQLGGATAQQKTLEESNEISGRNNALAFWAAVGHSLGSATLAAGQ